MARIPTMAVQHPTDPNRKMIINEADFHPDKHKKFEEKSTAEELEESWDRNMLIAKAEDLGLEYPKNISTKKLAERVAEALEE